MNSQVEKVHCRKNFIKFLTVFLIFGQMSSTFGQSAPIVYYASLSSGNAVANVVNVGSTVPSPFTSSNGNVLYVTPGATNTGAVSVVLPAVSTLVPIEKQTDNGLMPLSGGELQKNVVYALVYTTLNGGIFELSSVPQAGRTVNLQDFGVNCDGVTSTNQAFGNAATALGSTGGTISIPTGNCLITSSQLPSGYTATWSANSTVLIVTGEPSSDNVAVGQTVTGAGLQSNSVVTAHVTGTMTLSQATTAAETNASFTVGGVSFTGSWASGSTLITGVAPVPSQSLVNQTVVGAGIQTSPATKLTAFTYPSVTLSKFTFAAAANGPLTFTSGLIFSGNAVTLAGQGTDDGSKQFASVLTCATGVANCITFNGPTGGGMRDLGIDAAQPATLPINSITNDNGLLHVTVNFAAQAELSAVLPGGTSGPFSLQSSAAGISPGMTAGIAGGSSAISPGTTVTYVGVTSMTNASSSSGSNVLTLPSGVTEIVVGMPVTSGPGIPTTLTTVTVILSSRSVQISQAATTSAGTGAFSFAGGNNNIILSQTTGSTSGPTPPTLYFVNWTPAAGDVVNVLGFTQTGNNAYPTYANGAWTVAPVSTGGDVVNFDLATASNTGPNSAPPSLYSFNAPYNTGPSLYSFTATCAITTGRNTLKLCGPAYAMAPGEAVAGTSIPANSVITTVTGATATMNNAVSATGLSNSPTVLTFTNAYSSTGSTINPVVQGFRMEPGTYELMIMGGAYRMNFERLSFANGMNGVNFLNSNNMNFLYDTFIGFYDQQALLFNGASDPQQPQGFNCYQCSIASKSPTTDNVVFDGNAASAIFRDSYIAQGARRGVWFTDRYGGTCPGAVQLSGSGVGEATVGSSIELDCGTEFMMHDIIDLTNAGGGFNGIDGFGVNEGPGFNGGGLILTNNRIKGLPRDAIRVSGGNAQINNNYLSNNGSFNNSNQAVQVTAVTSNAAGQMRVSYSPGPWSPNPRDQVAITGAAGTTNGNWEVAPAAPANGVGILFSGVSVAPSTSTIALSGSSQFTNLIAGMAVTDTASCIPAATSISAVNVGAKAVTISATTTSSCATTNDSIIFGGSVSYTSVSESANSTTLTFASGANLANLAPGMIVVDSGGCLQTSPATTIVTVNTSSLTATISQPTASSCASGSTYSVIAASSYYFDLIGSAYTSANAYPANYAIAPTSLASAQILGDGLRITPGADNIQFAVNRSGVDIPGESNNVQAYGVYNDGDLTTAYIKQTITSQGVSSNCPLSGLCPYRITINSTGLPLLQNDVVTITNDAVTSLNANWPVNPLPATGSSQQFDIVGSSVPTLTPTSIPATGTLITFPSTAGVVFGMAVSSATPGIIAAGTTVSSVSATNVRLNNATLNSSNITAGVPSLQFVVTSPGGSAAVAPAPQTVMTVRQNDLIGNSVGQIYSEKYSNNIITRQNNGVPESDASFFGNVNADSSGSGSGSAKFAFIPSTSYISGTIAVISHIYVLMTPNTSGGTGACRITFYESNIMTPSIYTEVTPGGFHITAGVPFEQDINNGVIIDGTSIPVSLFYQWNSCNAPFAPAGNTAFIQTEIMKVK